MDTFAPTATSRKGQEEEGRSGGGRGKLHHRPCRAVGYQGSGGLLPAAMPSPIAVSPITMPAIRHGGKTFSQHWCPRRRQARAGRAARRTLPHPPAGPSAHTKHCCGLLVSAARCRLTRGVVHHDSPADLGCRVDVHTKHLQEGEETSRPPFTHQHTLAKGRVKGPSRQEEEARCCRNT